MIDVNAVALGLARRHNLIRNDGTIVCWECGSEQALLPSLHCPQCLDAAYARQGIANPQCQQAYQEQPYERD